MVKLVAVQTVKAGTKVAVTDNGGKVTQPAVEGQHFTPGQTFDVESKDEADALIKAGAARRPDDPEPDDNKAGVTMKGPDPDKQAPAKS